MRAVEFLKAHPRWWQRKKVPDGPSPSFPNPKSGGESQTTLPSANEERERKRKATGEKLLEKFLVVSM